MLRTVPPSLPAALSAAVLLTVANAQSLSLSSVITTTPIALTASVNGEPAQPVSLPAGHDITSSPYLSCSAGLANATLQGSFGVTNDQFTLSWLGQLSALTFSAREVSASYGRAGIVVELSVPRPMKLRLILETSAFLSPGAQPVRAEIDVDHDGTPEVQVTSLAGSGANTSRVMLVDVPAGRMQVGLLVEGSLQAVGGDPCLASSMTTRLTVQPAHVDLSLDESFCGGILYAVPRLDGENVGFAVGPQHMPGFAWLVLGAAPAQIPLLPSAGCNLLVVPDVIVPMPMWSMLDLPFARLGPSVWFAQGVTFQPPAFWLTAYQWRTSNRATLRIR